MIAALSTLALLAALVLPQQAATPTQASPAAQPVSPASATPAQPADLKLIEPDLDAAVAAYREGRYVEASAYFDLLARDERDAARAAVLHGNAGTAAARAERWGEAAWQLRLALQLAPRDPVAANNLRLLREQLGEGETESRHFTDTLLAVPLHLSPHENRWAASLAAGLALLLLALRRAGRAGAGTAWCAVALLLGAAAWWPLSEAAWTRERHRAVVIEPIVTGRAEPDAGAEALFRLSAGTVVRQAEARRDWRLIETGAGGRGWVPAAEVRPLTP